MTRDDIAATIERYVRRQFVVPDSDARFGRNVPLFGLGYVDSVGVVELLSFVQESYGVSIPDEDLLSDDFTTIDGMAGVIERLCRGAVYPISRASA